jgi:hypothetical protein
MSDPAGGIPCMWMRGGTSKGGFFLASDLPADPDERAPDLLELKVIDEILPEPPGGAHANPEAAIATMPAVVSLSSAS